MPIQIPEGMSSVDVFTALYRNAEVLGMGVLNPAAGVNPISPWNAIQIFKYYCRNDFCDYVRGKYMKVYFNNFPDLDVSRYDNYYGQGAAQKAIDAYQKTFAKPKSNSDEKYDLNCSPCAYFSSYWKEKTPEAQKKDLGLMFTECEQIKKSEDEAKNKFEKSPLSVAVIECEVKYAIVSPPVNYVPHRYKPCQEALAHFNTLLASPGGQNIRVEGLKICYLIKDHLPYKKRCQQHLGQISVKTAKNLLDYLTLFNTEAKKTST